MLVADFLFPGDCSNGRSNISIHGTSEPTHSPKHRIFVAKQEYKSYSQKPSTLLVCGMDGLFVQRQHRVEDTFSYRFFSAIASGGNILPYGSKDARIFLVATPHSLCHGSELRE